MAKKHKKKLKIKNLLIIVVLVVFIIIILPKSKEEDEVVKVNLNTMTKEEIKAYGDENNKKVNEKYEYNLKVSKDNIISVKEENNEINIIISKGDYDDDYYREKKVNEMGKVPIMMYHGIIDTEDNQYTGGNVGWKGDVPKFQYDLTKIHKAGWNATYTSDEAVRETVKHLKD